MLPNNATNILFNNYSYLGQTDRNGNCYCLLFVIRFIHSLLSMSNPESEFIHNHFVEISCIAIKSGSGTRYGVLLVFKPFRRNSNSLFLYEKSAA